MIDTNYPAEKLQKQFTNNMRALMAHEGINQKELAKILDTTETTISKYMNEDNRSLPQTDFLFRLKHVFKYVNIDDLFYKELSFDNEAKTITTQDGERLQTDIYKYYGLFYVYYLDTASYDSSRVNHLYLNTTPSLKRGLLYIYQNPSLGSDKAGCIAINNISEADTIARIRKWILGTIKRSYFKEKGSSLNLQPEKENSLPKASGKASAGHVHDLENDPDFKEYLTSLQAAREVQKALLSNETTTYRTYNGTLQLTQNHMYFLLQQAIDFEEPITIILNRKYFRKDSYIGGLGSMNTVSNGHPSEPCVQMVGISHKELNVFDAAIIQTLSFCAPLDIQNNATESMEEKKLLELAAQLYQPPEKPGTSSAMFQLSRKDKDILLRSKLHYLIRSNIQKNLLFYTKVTLEDDHNWYSLITGKVKPKKNQSNKMNEGSRS